MKKILLVRWGGLGDLIVALPAIRLVRLGFPSASLTLLGCREYGSLLLQAKVVNEVVGLDESRPRALFSEKGKAGDECADWPSQFDLVVSWLNRAGSSIPEVEGGRGGEKGKRHEICFDAREQEPVSVFFFRRTLAAVGGDLLGRPDFGECAKLPLNLIPDDPGFTFRRPPANSVPLVVIHPGSGGEKKRWPIDNFLEIARRLSKKKVHGVFITGEAEDILDRSMEAAARNLGWTWLKSPNLAALARVLGWAHLYLGNDSGVTHLAAACGASVLALFLNDLVDTWRPFGNSRLLSADSVDAIGIGSVWRAAAELLCR